jgi:sulfatase modifying factor 1
MLLGVCALLVVSCGGLALSNTGDAGTDGRRPDGPPSSGRSGDSGGTDATRDSAPDVVFADVADDESLCPEAGGSGSPPPSCALGGPGMSNCGPGGSGTESCCTSLVVCGGTYSRWYYYPNPDGGPTAEADPATVSGFRLDKYLVTVGRFRQFVAAWNGGFLPPVGSGKHAYLNGGKGLKNSGSPGSYETGWVSLDDSNISPTDANLACGPPYDAWTTTAGAQENLPINCVNWWESYAFCIWDGGFLPSEAEAEYAAAGGNEQRVYPWGLTDPGTTNQYAIYGCYYPSHSGTCTSVANLAAVGTAVSGVGRWGQLDLAGDVFEWSLDGDAPYVDPCADCADLTSANYRVSRGGSFGFGTSNLLPPRGASSSPTLRGNYNGFRCARAP